MAASDPLLTRLADRVNCVTPSFLRQILKVTQNPDIISFAGGLPNPELFPIPALAKAAETVFRDQGQQALQYTITAGYPPLRQWIVDRYYAGDPDITIDNVIITNGSQQAIDLIGKLLINPHDTVLVENPSYLGALQALSTYEASFKAVSLLSTGIDVDELNRTVSDTNAKLIYAVPNFQNPTGISYDLETRKKLANIVTRTDTPLIEDDPYHEIRFRGSHLPSVRSFAPRHTFHLGSFSKSVAPGFRLGWVCVPSGFLPQLTALKESADLHTSHVSQRIIYEYVSHNDLDEHINTIRRKYGLQRDRMIDAMKACFPADTALTQPDGGMFVWSTLPSGLSSSVLFDHAIARKVAFVPGKYFFASGNNDRCMRLNFSNADPEKIARGIGILGNAIRDLH